MNDKTKNKLNYVLEAVPMSREHKNMLVEVFDEVSAGANGGGGDPLIIKVYAEQNVNLENTYIVECDEEIHDTGSSNTSIQIASENIYNKIDNCINNNINVIISVIIDTGQMEFVNGIYIMKLSNNDGMKGYWLDAMAAGIDIMVYEKEIPTE